jgi:hypothetical protein
MQKTAVNITLSNLENSPFFGRLPHKQAEGDNSRICVDIMTWRIALSCRENSFHSIGESFVALRTTAAKMRRSHSQMEKGPVCSSETKDVGHTHINGSTGSSQTQGWTICSSSQEIGVCKSPWYREHPHSSLWLMQGGGTCCRRSASVGLVLFDKTRYLRCL